MNGVGAIPPELEEKVERELESGERIAWMEQPIPRYFTAMSTGAFLFAIPWTAFALFWICGASGFKLPDFSKGGFSFFPLFGVPFVLIGLGMLSSPWWAHRKALKTVYVITDRHHCHRRRMDHDDPQLSARTLAERLSEGEARRNRRRDSCRTRLVGCGRPTANARPGLSEHQRPEDSGTNAEETGGTSQPSRQVASRSGTPCLTRIGDGLPE